MGVLPKKIASFIPENVRQITKRFLQQFFHLALTKVSGGQDNALLWSYGQFELTPQIILKGYLQGIYPLPNMHNGKIIDWYDPEIRGIIPTQNFKLQKDLWRHLKKEKYQEKSKQFDVRVDTSFLETIVACSKPRGKETRTWLTPEFIKAALELHNMGFAHSVETYQNGILVGGVIGVAINGYFTTLSLFHSVDNASKIAFYYLLVKLRDDGFKLHVSGTANSWLSQYGMTSIPRDEFRKSLMSAITTPVTFSSKIPQLEL